MSSFHNTENIRLGFKEIDINDDDDWSSTPRNRHHFESCHDESSFTELSNTKRKILKRRHPLQPISPGLWQTTGTCCVLCHSKFTFFSRRHHCRMCGCLSCAHCSSRTYHYGRRDLRVCDGCFPKVKDYELRRGRRSTPHRELPPSLHYAEPLNEIPGHVSPLPIRRQSATPQLDSRAHPKGNPNRSSESNNSELLMRSDSSLRRSRHTKLSSCDVLCRNFRQPIEQEEEDLTDEVKLVDVFHPSNEVKQRGVFCVNLSGSEVCDDSVEPACEIRETAVFGIPSAIYTPTILSMDDNVDSPPVISLDLIPQHQTYPPGHHSNDHYRDDNSRIRDDRRRTDNSALLMNLFVTQSPPLLHSPERMNKTADQFNLLTDPEISVTSLQPVDFDEKSVQSDICLTKDKMDSLELYSTYMIYALHLIKIQCYFRI